MGGKGLSGHATKQSGWDRAKLVEQDMGTRQGRARMGRGGEGGEERRGERVDGHG